MHPDQGWNLHLLVLGMGRHSTQLRHLARARADEHSAFVESASERLLEGRGSSEGLWKAVFGCVLGIFHIFFLDFFPSNSNNFRLMEDFARRIQGFPSTLYTDSTSTTFCHVCFYHILAVHT